MRNPIVATLSNHLDGYPSPINLTYLWGFGSLAGMALVTQIITGVLLAMHYAPEIHLAFASVEHIMRDVNGGVALRYIHANGASMFFIIVYVHMFRGLYYGSYFQPRANLWYSGIIIFFLMMATGFMGYVLPWGQMSFWGATVITNLFSAIPVVGNSIVQLLWGGFSVDNPTLNRFFSLHYLLPFAIAGVALLHLILLHQHGSNNPLGISSLPDKIPFYPYYYVKDLFGFFIFVAIFSFFVIYAPNYLGHPDNYIEANPLVTPAHIVPEWYFLPFYAILRTIPDKLGGVVLMVVAIFILALLPVVDTSVFRSTFFKPLNIWFFWYFFSDTISLGWIGQEIVESPFIEMANFVTLSYFLYFIPLLPLIGFLENAVITQQLQMRKSAAPFVRLSSFSLGKLDIPTKYTNPYKIEILAEMDQPVSFSIGDEWLLTLGTWLHCFQIGFILTFLLLLSTRYTRNGEFARLLNKLSYIYLMFNLWMATADMIFRVPSSLVFDFSGVNSWETLAKVVQGDSLLFYLFSIFATLTVAIFFYGITDRFFIANSYETEYPLVVWLAYFGAMILLRIETLLEFIIAIEIVTFASYILVAYDRKTRFGSYAGVQYFILGSIPSAFLILSIGLIYYRYGMISLADLDIVAGKDADYNPYYVPGKDANGNGPFKGACFPGLEHTNWNALFEYLEFKEAIGFMTIITFSFNLLFKLTAAPFHFWAVSVYEKAPISSVTILSIFTKAMILFLILKVFYTAFFAFKYIIAPFYVVVGIFTLLVALIGAFITKVVKKFFVYSSMGHVAFMLIPIALFNVGGEASSLHYLAVYIISSFIMWFVVFIRKRDNHSLTFFKQFKASDPLIGLIFALLIFSMSGIPPFGGFFVKLDVLTVLLENSRFYTNYLLFFFTVASFFYYLRLIKIIYFDGEKEYVKGELLSEERLLVIIVLFLILAFYIFFVEAPLLFVEMEYLKSSH